MQISHTKHAVDSIKQLSIQHHEAAHTHTHRFMKAQNNNADAATRQTLQRPSAEERAGERFAVPQRGARHWAAPHFEAKLTVLSVQASARTYCTADVCIYEADAPI